MNFQAYVQDWQCPVNLLSKTLYRRFQHSSLHSQESQLPSALASSQQKKHHQSKKTCVFKLPHLRASQTYKCGKENVLGKGGHTRPQKMHKTTSEASSFHSKVGSDKEAYPQAKPDVKEIFKNSIMAYQSKSTTKGYRKGVEKPTKNSGENERYFSYIRSLCDQILAHIDSGDASKHMVKELADDLSLLASNFERKASLADLAQKMQEFKKEQKQFQFKTIWAKLLYHKLASEVALSLNKPEQAVDYLQICEYYARKNGYDRVVVCLLWQMANIHLKTANYSEADAALRNLIEMSVVMGSLRAQQLALEKISVLYYNKGNAVMGKYYLEVSEKGLPMSEQQIYYKQYDREDEIKRLEHKIFRTPYENVLKRKNNVKFEEDLWRHEKQEYERQSFPSYMDQVREMVRYSGFHEQSKIVKSFADSISSIGCVKQLGKVSVSQQKCPHLTAEPKFADIQPSSRVDNVTGVVKSHLSGGPSSGSTKDRRSLVSILGLVAKLSQQLRYLA